MLPETAAVDDMTVIADAGALTAIGGEAGIGGFEAMVASDEFVVAEYGDTASAALAVFEGGALASWPVNATARFPTVASIEATI